jgi:hypothetical protein
MPSRESAGHRQTSPGREPTTRSSAGSRGQSLAPPSYGIRFADRSPGRLPDRIKTGVEHLSGIDLGDVRVHYDSPQPARHRALAFTRGSEIHVGPGQDRHLAHEAWHVVQQKQGRVAATQQFAGVATNHDAGLEREADVMGDRAVAMSVPRGPAPPLRTASFASRGVMQMKLATVDPQTGPIRLKEDDEFMKNPGQADGEEVSNAVGFTEILNRDAWGDLGKSPRNYWRAHGYAKSFGGAGSAENVGWWPAAQEDQWTTLEQKVRGGGNDKIAAWKPNKKETGHYKVTRVLKPAVDVISPYLAGLEAGAAWGLGNGRNAWTRAMTKQGQQPHRFSVADFNTLKGTLEGQVTGYLTNWLNAVFGTAGSQLIDSMRMEYTILSTGDGGAGNQHVNIDETLNAPDLDTATIGLKNQPQKIWEAMFNRTGSFARGPHPLGSFKKHLASQAPHDPGIDLDVSADGWGL